MQKPRSDLYGPIHQGIRRLLFENALELGATDRPWRREAQAAVRPRPSSTSSSSAPTISSAL